MDYSSDTTDMLLKEICQDFKILKFTWLSALLAKSLISIAFVILFLSIYFYVSIIRF